MKITKKFLQEAIINELQDLKNLDSTYDKLIENQKIIINSLKNNILLTEAEKNVQLSNIMATGSLEDMKKALKQVQDAASKRTQEVYKIDPKLASDAAAKSLISKAYTESQITLQSLIGKFLKQAKDLKIQNPEGYAAILMDEIIRGAANIVSREQTPVRVNAAAAEIEKADSSAKPPPPPADVTNQDAPQSQQTQTAEPTEQLSTAELRVKHMNTTFNRANELLNAQKKANKVDQNYKITIQDIQKVFNYLMLTDKYKLVETAVKGISGQKVVSRNTEFGKLVSNILKATKLPEITITIILNALINQQAFGKDKKIDIGTGTGLLDKEQISFINLPTNTVNTSAVANPPQQALRVGDALGSGTLGAAQNIKEHLKKRNNYELLRSQLLN